MGLTGATPVVAADEEDGAGDTGRGGGEGEDVGVLAVDTGAVGGAATVAVTGAEAAVAGALGAIITSLFGIKESPALTGILTEDDIPTAEGGVLGAGGVAGVDGVAATVEGAVTVGGAEGAEGAETTLLPFGPTAAGAV